MGEDGGAQGWCFVSQCYAQFHGVLSTTDSKLVLLTAGADYWPDHWLNVKSVKWHYCEKRHCYTILGLALALTISLAADAHVRLASGNGSVNMMSQKKFEMRHHRNRRKWEYCLWNWCEREQWEVTAVHVTGWHYFPKRRWECRWRGFSSNQYWTFYSASCYEITTRVVFAP